MIPVTFKKALLTDVTALQQLIALSVRGLSVGYNTESQIESALKYVFGIDTQLIADQTYFMGVDGDVIVACGGWSKRNTLYGGDQHKETVDPLLDPLTDAARIRAFFVHPDYARQGIGRQLITLCEDEARQYGFSRITMGATLPGVPLYEAVGYQSIENIPTLMPDGEILPIVQMEKSLV